MRNLFQVMPGPSSGKRLRGHARFMELLGRDTARFLKINFMTLLCFAPFGIGLVISVLSSSILVMLLSGSISGLLAGPAVCGMHDCIFRSLRDAPGTAFQNYKKSWKQNVKGALLPGCLSCTVIGFYCFVLAMFSWARVSQTAGTYIAYLVGLFVFSVISTVTWPLITLFEQSASDRIRNITLFCARYLWRVLACAMLNVLYWAVLLIFLPWSVFLLPVTGFWLIFFLTDFLLFEPINEAFGLEDAISKAFPEQAAYYETDAEWADRRKAEDASGKNI